MSGGFSEAPSFIVCEFGGYAVVHVQTSQLWCCTGYGEPFCAGALEFFAAQCSQLFFVSMKGPDFLGVFVWMVWVFRPGLAREALSMDLMLYKVRPKYHQLLAYNALAK